MCALHRMIVLIALGLLLTPISAFITAFSTGYVPTGLLVIPMVASLFATGFAGAADAARFPYPLVYRLAVIAIAVASIGSAVLLPTWPRSIASLAIVILAYRALVLIRPQRAALLCMIAIAVELIWLEIVRIEGYFSVAAASIAAFLMIATLFLFDETGPAVPQARAR